MTNYVLSVDADLDLDEIWEYIAAHSIDAAANEEHPHPDSVLFRARTGRRPPAFVPRSTVLFALPVTAAR